MDIKEGLQNLIDHLDIRSEVCYSKCTDVGYAESSVYDEVINSLTNIIEGMEEV